MQINQFYWNEPIHHLVWARWPKPYLYHQFLAVRVSLKTQTPYRWADPPRNFVRSSGSTPTVPYWFFIIKQWTSKKYGKKINCKLFIFKIRNQKEGFKYSSSNHSPFRSFQPRFIPQTLPQIEYKTERYSFLRSRSASIHYRLRLLMPFIRYPI